jgi:hypothetical protein
MLATVAAIAIGFAACSERGEDPAGPNLPPNPPANPALRAAAFIVDVNTATGRVKISAPESSTDELAAALAPYFDVLPEDIEGGIPGPSMSLLGGDVIDLIPTNFFASEVGVDEPNKVTVTIDVSIFNQLAGVQLVTPTWPEPPTGVDGIFLIPIENVVTETTGGVGTAGEGNEIIVELPSRGLVDAAGYFDGAEYNWFNDEFCEATDNDCFRYETYPQALLPQTSTAPQQVGWFVDPTVHDFRSFLIVAANIENAGTVDPGTVAGTVSSPQRGALQDVIVTVTPGGQGTATTDAAGAYSLAVNPGFQTVSLSNLPAACTDPGSQTVTVTSGNTSTVNFSVSCTVPTGTVQGTLTASYDGSPLQGVQVTITPTGLGAQSPVTSDASGFYSDASVPVGDGTGSVTLGNLPSNCTDPGATGYTGLSENGTVTVDITVSCTEPQSGYEFSVVWGTPTDTDSDGNPDQVTATVYYDMCDPADASSNCTFNDPAINGSDPDDIGVVSFTVNYDATRLLAVAATPIDADPGDPGLAGLGSSTPNLTTAGQAIILALTTDPNNGAVTGLVPVVDIVFTIAAGAGQTVTTSTALSTAADYDGVVDLIPNTLKFEGTITLPGF